jgi:hypothetical protein
MRRGQAGFVAMVGAAICAAALLLFAFAAPLAAANDLFTLAPATETPGRVVEDAAGNAYVDWVVEGGSASAPNQPMFCKIAPGGTCTHPIALTIPGATKSTESVSGAFPVLGAGSTVYVVAPRYVQNDVIVWTSTNGGESFNAGTENKGGYPSKTDPASVLLRKGNEFVIGAFNAGVGFGSVPAAGGSGENLSFASPGLGGVATASLGLDSSENPVEAYWNLSSPYEVFFYNYKGTGVFQTETNWSGPTAVADGYESKLAGGPGGLYLVSQDYPAGGSEPTQVDVRKYSGTTFGPAVPLANDQTVDLFDGGAIAEAPNGLLAVAWPELTSSGSPSAMRLWVSSNGGASFSESVVAHLGSGYEDMDNAQMAIGSNGQGWLTYVDAAGLQVADLTPLPAVVPIVAPPAPPAVPKATTPATYSGKTLTIEQAVGGNLLTLTVPKECLAPSQPFYIGVGKKARHRIAKSLRSTLKVVKVTFSFDGKKLKTLKKKPFRYLVRPDALAAGSKHTVTARVTAIVIKHGQKKKVVRVLEGQVTIC